MTELNVTAHRFAVHAEQRLLVGFVGHLRLFKEAEHALGSGRATLQVLECLRELGKRLGEQSNVHHERNDHTKLDLAIHRKHSANHAHNHVAEIADEIHQRHHQAGKELALAVRLIDGAVHAESYKSPLYFSNARIESASPQYALTTVWPAYISST